MSFKFKPLADRVIIDPSPTEQKTASGIFIPDTAKEKPLQGTIIAVGDGKKDEPLLLKKGDKVLYGQYAGTEIKIDKHRLLWDNFPEAQIFLLKFRLQAFYFRQYFLLLFYLANKILALVFQLKS